MGVLQHSGCAGHSVQYWAVWQAQSACNRQHCTHASAVAPAGTVPVCSWKETQQLTQGGHAVFVGLGGLAELRCRERSGRHMSALAHAYASLGGSGTPWPVGHRRIHASCVGE